MKYSFSGQLIKRKIPLQNEVLEGVFVKLILFFLLTFGNYSFAANNHLFPLGVHPGACVYQINTELPVNCNAGLNIIQDVTENFLTIEELVCPDLRQTVLSAFKLTNDKYIDWIEYGEGICENDECNLTWNDERVAAIRKMTFSKDIITVYEETSWLQIGNKIILDCKYQI